MDTIWEYNYEQNWVRCTQTQFWFPLPVNLNHKQSDEVIKARVQMNFYINMKAKNEKKKQSF